MRWSAGFRALGPEIRGQDLWDGTRWDSGKGARTNLGRGPALIAVAFCGLLVGLGYRDMASRLTPTMVAIWSATLVGSRVRALRRRRRLNAYTKSIAAV